MNRIRHFIIIYFSFIFLSALFAARPCSAARINLDINGYKPIICDNADIFNEYEEITIIDKAEELYQKTGFIYVFISTDNTKDYKASHELEDIYNDHREAFTGTGVVLLLISTDTANPICELQAYRTAADFFPRSVCDYIKNKITPETDRKAYAEAMNTLFTELEKAYNGEINEAYSSDKDSGITNKLKDRFPAIIIAACISFLLSAVIIAIAVKNGKKGYKKPHHSNNDIAPGSVKTNDIYIRSIVNTYKKI